MMRNSMTAVLERDGIVGPTYTTEPYEVAWATEARWFVRTLAVPDQVERVELTVQVSPDGLYWCDVDDAPPITGPGLITWVTHEFGGWLRLRAQVTGVGSHLPVQALIYLALKG